MLGSLKKKQTSHFEEALQEWKAEGLSLKKIISWIWTKEISTKNGNNVSYIKKNKIANVSVQKPVS